MKLHFIFSLVMLSLVGLIASTLAISFYLDWRLGYLSIAGWVLFIVRMTMALARATERERHK